MSLVNYFFGTQCTSTTVSDSESDPDPHCHLRKSQYSMVVLTVVRVIIAMYKK